MKTYKTVVNYRASFLSLRMHVTFIINKIIFKSFNTVPREVLRDKVTDVGLTRLMEVEHPGKTLE